MSLADPFSFVHTPELVSVTVGFIALNSVAIVADALIIISLLQSGLQYVPNESLLVLNLCVGDLLYCLTSMIMGVAKMIAGGFLFGSAGKALCTLEASLLILSFGVSLSSLIAITLLRYLVICRRMDIDRKWFYVIIASIWAFLILIILIVVFPAGLYEYGIGTQNNIYCLVNFYDSSARPLMSFVSYAIAIVITIPIPLMIYAYYSIITTFLTARRIRKKKNEERHRLQYRLIKKCLAITLSFITLWFPFIVKVCLEISTGRQVSFVYEVVSSFLAISNSISNSILLALFDGSIRGNLRDLMVPFHERLARNFSSSVDAFSSPTLEIGSGKQVKAAV